MDKPDARPQDNPRGGIMAVTNSNLLALATLATLAMAVLAPTADIGAEELAAATWKVLDGASGQPAPQVSDDNLATQWSGDPEKGIIVDLGPDILLQRVYLRAGTEAAFSDIRLSFQAQRADPGATTLRYYKSTAEWWKWPTIREEVLAAGTGDLLPMYLNQGQPAPADTRTEANLKFRPSGARYLAIRGLKSIAEMELYGWRGPAMSAKVDAVSIPAKAPGLLRLGAADLSYYLGELAGRPVPIITPEQEKEYSGTIYRIEDLKSLAPDYPTMLANLRSGKLPTGGPLPESVVSLQTMRLPDGVNVVREGNVVAFRAWPYANVMFSVYEFLRRQGVVWAYPDSHGELVPAGHGVNLSLLPLTGRPSAELRTAGFDDSDHLFPYTDAFLYFLRNGYNSDWGSLRNLLFQHGEVPPLPATALRTAKTVDPINAEGFEGSPHNFNAVIPERILVQHPDWCGMTKDGKRLSPKQGGTATFCMTSSGAIRFVADKIIDWVGDNRDSRACFKLVPMDGCDYCQCESCLKLYQPYQRPDLPWVPGMDYMVSDAYYHFIAEVAKLVAPKAPGVRIDALAYADTLLPPRNIAKLPDNVWVQVCQYGSRNLPMSSPANAAMRACMEEWAAKCAHLSFYSYALIEGEWMELPTPLPAVTAFADQAAFLDRLGAWNGGSQSYIHCLPHNPWNHYAFVRLMWNVRLGATAIKDEFFPAYYREAAVPMREYYDTLERHNIDNNVDQQFFGYDQGPNPATFTPAVVAKVRSCLAGARQQARRWYIKERIDTAIRDLDWSIPVAQRRSGDPATALAAGKMQYVCHRRTGDIALDGKLDDPAWKNLPAMAGFFNPRTLAPEAAEGATSFRMTWDETHLYLGVDCRNPEMAKLVDQKSVWGKDVDAIEAFLTADPAYTAAYYQFAIASFGATFGPIRVMHDQWHKDLAARPVFESVVARHGQGWSCEIKVPFASLREGAPKIGDTWRVNLARVTGNTGFTWSKLQFPAWGLYRDYNLALFADAKAP